LQARAALVEISPQFPETDAGMNMRFSPSGKHIINGSSEDSTIFGGERSDLLEQLAVYLNP
jgi:hypothetical protein